MGVVFPEQFNSLEVLGKLSGLRVGCKSNLVVGFIFGARRFSEGASLGGCIIHLDVLINIIMTNKSKCVGRETTNGEKVSDLMEDIGVIKVNPKFKLLCLSLRPIAFAFHS